LTPPPYQASGRLAVRAFPDQHRTAFDDGVKHTVVGLVAAAAAAGAPLMEYTPPGSACNDSAVLRFLSICLWMADAGLEAAPGVTTGPALPPRVLEWGEQQRP
jgi:hypothetical protein